MNWGPLTLAMKSPQFDLVKLMVMCNCNGKVISTARTINAILLNIKKNQPKLVHVCGYKLATNWHSFMKIYLALVKILQKVLGDTFFDWHCMCSVLMCVFL